MVSVEKVELKGSKIILHFNTNGILISTMLDNDIDLSTQETVKKAYEQIKTHIIEELNRLEILEQDHELATIEDELTFITIVGIEDIHFTEGQPEIQKSFRCVGYTKYGKYIDLTDLATFTPSREIIINPTENYIGTIRAEYNTFIDEASYEVEFIPSITDPLTESILLEDDIIQ